MKLRHIRNLICSCILVAWALAATPPARACEYIGPSSPSISIQRADTVFTGTVIDTDNNALTIFGDNWLSKTALFEVTTVFKGMVQSQVVLQVYESSCGKQEIWFNKGESFLVYVETDYYGKQYTAHNSGTKPLGQADEDFPVLGQASPPSKSVDLRNVFYLQSDGFVLSAILVLILAGWGLIKLVRRPRTNKHNMSL